MNELPHCDELFSQFFDRWYSDEWREWKAYSATRPDLEETDSYTRCEADALSPLNADGRNRVAKMIETMIDAAVGDWVQYLSITLPVDLDWIAKFDAYYDRPRIVGLIERSDPEDFQNDYLVTCCEFGAVLGTVFVAKLPTLSWLYAWPYWESQLLHNPSGSLIPPFHWAIKKMSEYGVDDGMAAKLQACVRILREKEVRA